jgi:hypothetical protein
MANRIARLRAHPADEFFDQTGITTTIVRQRPNSISEPLASANTTTHRSSLVAKSGRVHLTRRSRPHCNQNRVRPQNDAVLRPRQHHAKVKPNTGPGITTQPLGAAPHLSIPGRPPEGQQMAGCGPMRCAPSFPITGRSRFPQVDFSKAPQVSAICDETPAIWNCGCRLRRSATEPEKSTSRSYTRTALGRLRPDAVGAQFSDHRPFAAREINLPRSCR